MFLRCKNCDYRSPEQEMLLGLCHECVNRALRREDDPPNALTAEQEEDGSPDADSRTGIAYGDLT